AVAVRDEHGLAAGPEEHDLLRVLLELPPRRVQVETELLADRLKHTVEVLAAEPRPRRDRTLRDAEVVVGHHQLGIHFEARAEPVTALARAVGRVEREVPWRELLEAQAATRAREVLREGQYLRVGV